MRRKDRERTEAFAWEVLRKAPYATISMITPEGRPYCVPVNLAVNPEGTALYLHCAGAGEKWSILEKDPKVCVSAVSRIAVVPGAYTVSYDSAIVHGLAKVVTDETERMNALVWITEALDKPAVATLTEQMGGYFAQIKIVKIIPVSVTGKQNPD